MVYRSASLNNSWNYLSRCKFRSFFQDREMTLSFLLIFQYSFEEFSFSLLRIQNHRCNCSVSWWIGWLDWPILEIFSQDVVSEVQTLVLFGWRSGRLIPSNPCYWSTGLPKLLEGPMTSWGGLKSCNWINFHTSSYVNN